jgi:hypothetical protein
MRKDRENIRQWSLDDLWEALTDQIDGIQRLYASAEFTRRTAEAQTEAAKSMQDIAASTSKKVTAVVVITALVTLLLQALSWLWPNPLHLH